MMCPKYRFPFEQHNPECEAMFVSVFIFINFYAKSAAISLDVPLIGLKPYNKQTQKVVCAFN